MINQYQSYVKPRMEEDPEYREKRSKLMCEYKKKLRETNPEKYHEQVNRNSKACYDNNEEYRERKKTQMLARYYRLKELSKISLST
jgi:hypothetical protein